MATFNNAPIVWDKACPPDAAYVLDPRAINTVTHPDWNNAEPKSEAEQAMDILAEKPSFWGEFAAMMSANVGLSTASPGAALTVSNPRQLGVLKGIT